MKQSIVILLIILGIIPGGPSFLRPLGPQKDSVRVADQFRYGFRLEKIEEGTAIALPDLKNVFNDTLVLVKDWQLDTIDKKGTIEASIVIAPFEEGEFVLPQLAVVVAKKGAASPDTLSFDPQNLTVVPIQIDTATYKIADIKGQVRYPVTFKEVLPWAGGGLGACLLVVLAVFLLKRLLSRRKTEEKSSDPAYIVALRELEKYRSEKFLAPEKQKAYYSGITDALKVYMEDRYGVDAPEMTTAELFDAVGKIIPADLAEPLKNLFEEADFVKFAKHAAEKETAAKALPLAMNFVTSTYIKPGEQEAPKQ